LFDTQDAINSQEEVMIAARENKLSVALAAIALAAVAFWATPLRAEDGAGLYKTKCAMCHGADGKGATPMGKNLGIRDLTSADVQKQSDPELTTIVSKGKNKMPAYGAKLTNEQIGQLVTYIREIGKK
jgi:mono/diheme cytochrome c family protein